MKFLDYCSGERVVSLAKDETTVNDLKSEGVDSIEVINGQIILQPSGMMLELSDEDYEELTSYNNYDVIEIWEDGRAFRRYDNSSTENYFFVTGKCNSNCVMCPSAEYSRRNGIDTEVQQLISIAEHIPANTSHLTITGGEPFLLGSSLFQFIGYLKEKFEETEFLFLTNGRIFSVGKYAVEFKNCIPNISIVAIPIHGSNSKTHDAITQVDNSFKQTITGIKNLLQLGIKVEIRIVVSKLNIDDLREIAKFISNELSNIEYVSIIAMEMTGSAFSNRDKVWISYKESFSYVKEAIEVLISNEIDVKLYNFPLCTVDRNYWTLCERSISAEKIVYSDVCDRCVAKSMCGGLFFGTIRMEERELEPIYEVELF